MNRREFLQAALAVAVAPFVPAPQPARLYEGEIGYYKSVRFITSESLPWTVLPKPNLLKRLPRAMRGAGMWTPALASVA